MFKVFVRKDYTQYFDVYKNKNVNWDVGNLGNSRKETRHKHRKYISVSHCGNLTFVIVKNHPVGLDVERIKKIDDKLWEYMGLSRTNRISFFREWTRREAYIKLHDLKLGEISNIKPTGKIRTYYVLPFVISVCEEIAHE